MCPLCAQTSRVFEFSRYRLNPDPVQLSGDLRFRCHHSATAPTNLVSSVAPTIAVSVWIVPEAPGGSTRLRLISSRCRTTASNVPVRRRFASVHLDGAFPRSGLSFKNGSSASVLLGDVCPLRLVVTPGGPFPPDSNRGTAGSDSRVVSGSPEESRSWSARANTDVARDVPIVEVLPAQKGSRDAVAVQSGARLFAGHGSAFISFGIPVNHSFESWREQQQRQQRLSVSFAHAETSVPGSDGQRSRISEHDLDGFPIFLQHLDFTVIGSLALYPNHGRRVFDCNSSAGEELPDMLGQSRDVRCVLR